jgi:hypothetical protein
MVLQYAVEEFAGRAFEGLSIYSLVEARSFTHYCEARHPHWDQ